MVLHIVSLTSTFADYFTFLLVPYKGAQKHATHQSELIIINEPKQVVSFTSNVLGISSDNLVKKKLEF